MKLNGLIRFQITKLWMQKGMVGDLEKYIKEVCLFKKIEYVPQKELKK